ncbi:MAG: ECF transporter S component [Eubacteriaceae bacterium]
MQTNAKTARLTKLALLAAIEVLLAFTPLGFIQLPIVSITTLHIPVIIGAIILGPWEGGFLGLVMGLCSVIRSFTSASVLAVYINPAISGNALASIVMDIVPRILIGVVAGYIYLSMKKHEANTSLSIGVAAVFGSLTNTVLFLGSMALFFPASQMLNLLATIVSINSIAEIAAAAIISIAVCIPVMKSMRKKIIVKN